jgi:hypothetical protein
MNREIKFRALNTDYLEKPLMEYFKWSYNFSEKQFDTIYLESFNLAKCKMCAE